MQDKADPLITGTKMLWNREVKLQSGELLQRGRSLIDEGRELIKIRELKQGCKLLSIGNELLRQVFVIDYGSPNKNL